MDDQRFDRFAKLIGSGASRRRVLKTLACGALASIAVGFAGEAGASTRKRSAGNSCTVNADCASNRCVAEGGARKICHCGADSDCPANADRCHPAICQPNGACVVTPVTCTAMNQCHDVGTCDPGTGICSNPTRTDGTPCNDGDACTQTDACQDGVCVGSNPVTCTASDQCHDAGTCDPSTGTCSNPAKKDGVGCNNGNVCTTGETCQAGVCTGGVSMSCPSGFECVNGGCFQIGCEECASACDDCVGSVQGSGNFLCVKLPRENRCGSNADCPIGQACQGSGFCVAPCS